MNDAITLTITEDDRTKGKTEYTNRCKILTCCMVAQSLIRAGYATPYVGGKLIWPDRGDISIVYEADETGQEILDMPVQLWDDVQLPATIKLTKVGADWLLPEYEA